MYEIGVGGGQIGYCCVCFELSVERVARLQYYFFTLADFQGR
jgi:hypothetical protein